MPSPPSKAAFPLALPAPFSAPYGHAHRASYAKHEKSDKILEIASLLSEMSPGIVLVIGIMLFGSDIYSLFPLYNSMAILIITYAILSLPYTAEYLISG